MVMQLLDKLNEQEKVQGNLKPLEQQVNWRKLEILKALVKNIE